MNGFLQLLGAVGGVVGLLGFGAGVWAIIKSTAQEATIERQRKEITDYLQRLNYVEPRLEVLDRENKTLHRLHNPVEAIGQLNTQVAELTSQEQRNHDATLDELRTVSSLLRSQK